VTLASARGGGYRYTGSSVRIAGMIVKHLDLLRLHSSWVVYFNEVARSRSIRAAARRLNVAAAGRRRRDGGRGDPRRRWKASRSLIRGRG